MNANKKVIVIEDEADILEDICDLLRFNRYLVSTLSDGKDALEKIRALAPDIILLDVMLGEWSGIDICQALKADPQLKLVPVILLSAKSQKTDIESGFKIGADRYMVKPFKNEDLMNTIKSLLS